jgi:hypothetical protein
LAVPQVRQRPARQVRPQQQPSAQPESMVRSEFALGLSWRLASQLVRQPGQQRPGWPEPPESRPELALPEAPRAVRQPGQLVQPRPGPEQVPAPAPGAQSVGC